VRLLTQTRELLTDWPVDRQARWTAQVNEAETTEDLEQFRAALPHSDRKKGGLSVARGKPLTLRTDVGVKGNPTWAQRLPVRRTETGTIAGLGLESSIRPRGRPRKQPHEKA